MKNRFLLLLFILGFTACIKDRAPEPAAPNNPDNPVTPGVRQLIHYWSFNGKSLLVPDTTIGGAAITVGGVFDAAQPGTLLNSRQGQGQDTGSALRVRNPSTNFVMKVPTTGYKQPLLRFAVQRTSSGAQENIVSYTLNGTDYITTGITANTLSIDTLWQLYSFDFAGIAGVDNNANFAVKITFNIGNTAATGNDRYDNISIDALRDSSVIVTPPPPPPPPPPPAGTDTLLHYWNFNTFTDDMVLFTKPTLTIGGAALNYAGAKQDTVQTGATLNARRGDATGGALRLRNPAGSFVITLPTTGFKDLKLKYAVTRTGSGAQSNEITYTINGTTYTAVGLVPATNIVTEEYTLVTYDFSAIAAAANNPNFKIKIDFGTGAANTSGNNRFDNITLEGRRQ